MDGVLTADRNSLDMQGAVNPDWRLIARQQQIATQP
jgi:hypothetical protein